MERALDYAALLQPREVVAEPAPDPVSAKGELEWQAHWFAGDFGATFDTVTGERVEVIQPGVWNHESGPDFREAAVRFPDRPGAPTLRGDIELDLAAEDWERHGHAGNPAFNAVVLHLFFARREPGRAFWTRTAAHGNVPQVQLDRRRLAELPSPPGDLPAARPGRCAAPLRELPAGRVGELLAAAARHRLERKAARFSRLAAARGRDEALFQSLAAALGYKENALAFTLLAQRLPLRTLLAEPPGTAAALLFGLAGFLGRAPEFADTDDARETRAYLRGLWETWWTRRDALARLALPAESWTLGGQRPANHPQRRVAALAAVVRRWPAVRALLDSPDPAREVPRVLGELSDPYWDFHYTLSSARSPKPLALIGETRATEMLANVFFPLAVAARPGAAWAAYGRLPARLTNRRVETAATRLFGEDAGARRAWTKRAVNQQGLLQIYEDFCLRDASDCARCTLPERLRGCGLAA